MEIKYLYLQGDSGAKAVVGDVNLKFSSPLAREYIETMYGVPGAPKDSNIITTYVCPTKNSIDNFCRLHGATAITLI